MISAIAKRSSVRQHRKTAAWWRLFYVWKTTIFPIKVGEILKAILTWEKQPCFYDSAIAQLSLKRSHMATVRRYHHKDLSFYWQKFSAFCSSAIPYTDMADNALYEILGVSHKVSDSDLKKVTTLIDKNIACIVVPLCLKRKPFYYTRCCKSSIDFYESRGRGMTWRNNGYYQPFKVALHTTFVIKT